MARPRQRRAPAIIPVGGFLRPSAGLKFLLPYAVIGMLALLFLWGRVHISQLATDIAELEQQRQQLLDRNEKLRVQIEQLSSYGRISHLARARSGMVPLRPQLLIVDDE